MKQLLALGGIGEERLQLRWVSAAEGQLFADYVSELSASIQKLRPFRPQDFKLQLAASERALKSPRIRWLIGMARQITERENVYHETLETQAYERLVSQALTEEYHKGLILEVLGDGPLSVREVAGKTALPVYTVSLRLNDLERTNQAQLQGFEGRTPRFTRPAA